MTAGTLDRRIQIQTRQGSRNSDGSQASTWTTTRSCWANRRDLVGSQVVAGERQTDLLQTDWTVRYFAGASGAERIVDENGNIYIVKGAPRERGRREWLVFTAERGGAL